MWLVLSIAVMQVQEWLASKLKWRARDLEAAISIMLADKEKAKAFYDHPLVKGLCEPKEKRTLKFKDDKGKFTIPKFVHEPKEAKPSYIPAKTFALVVFDIAGVAKNVKVDQIRSNINALPDSKLKTSLNALLLDAEKDINKARTSVETWFDGTMDRMSGWYKRRSQGWALLFGLLLAVIMNVDSIAIAKQMWREPAVRQVFADKANEIQLPSQIDPKNPSAAIQEFYANFDGLNIPLGWIFEPVNLSTKDNSGKSITYSCVFRPQGTLDAFGFNFDKAVNIIVFQIKKGCYRPINTETSTDGWSWAGLKFLGILISALATLQGAPFWFDILKKLVNVRGAGVKPEEATEKKKPAG